MRKITGSDLETFQFDMQSSRDDSGGDSFAYLQKKVDEEFELFRNP